MRILRKCLHKKHYSHVVNIVPNIFGYPSSQYMTIFFVSDSTNPRGEKCTQDFAYTSINIGYSKLSNNGPKISLKNDKSLKKNHLHSILKFIRQIHYFSASPRIEFFSDFSRYCTSEWWLLCIVVAYLYSSPPILLLYHHSKIFGKTDFPFEHRNFCKSVSFELTTRPTSIRFVSLYSVFKSQRLKIVKNILLTMYFLKMLLGHHK